MMSIHNIRCTRQVFKSMFTFTCHKNTSEFVKPTRCLSNSVVHRKLSHKRMTLDRPDQLYQVNSVCRRCFTQTVTLCEKEDQTKHPIGELKGTMYISFTCKICQTKNAHTFSKHAYRKGVVIVTCDGCNNHHLIADNLDWFSHFKSRNIEEFLAEKGEKINKGSNFEYVENQKTN